MAVRARRKPLYRLEEVSQRWNLSIWDIAAYAVAREIAISFVATGLLAEEGIIDHTPDGAPQHIRQGERLLSGPVDLHGDDVWTIVQRGTHRVQRFVAEPGEYLELRTPRGEADPVEVPAQELVVRHAELERFEAAQSLQSASDGPVLSPVVVLTPRPRGAQPTHDWEACWVEICRTLYFDGLPENQAGLVRRLQDWFDAEGRKVPDESTLKKKVKAVWRVFAPEVERKSA
jgi:hypothetical protein